MMPIIRLSLSSFLLICASLLTAQSDTATVMSREQFLKIVAKNHPLARKAQLVQPAARAGLLSAKGQFDPVLFANWNQKHFDDKDYYRFMESGLLIPTITGIEVKASYQWNRGYQINPENKLPDQGQAKIGVSIPLLQGLVIDRRRTDLRLANIAVASSAEEARNMLNDLYFDASVVYWEWAGTWQEAKILERSTRLASVRFEAVKESFRGGDRPGIDTTEALVILQDRQYQLNAILVELENARLALSAFLWDDNGEPLEISPNLVPEDISILPTAPLAEENLEQLLNVLEQHPQLRLTSYKLDALSVERKWKAEKLKPKLNLYYNILGNGFDVVTDKGYGPPPWNDFQLGIQLSTPLLAREARGDLQENKIKQEQTALDFKQKSLDLSIKLRMLYNKVNNNSRQAQLFREATAGSRELFNVESYRFSLGESTLFLVNSREGKLLEMEQKLIGLLVKYQQERVALEWAAGQAAN